MKPRTMSVPKMAVPGHYRPPKAPGSTAYNKPKVGRIGKQLPSPKQFRPLKPPGRPR